MSTQEPREIAFEDIRKGDDIEVRYTREGVAHTRRGVAYEADPRDLPDHWFTKAGGLVANRYDGDWQHFLHFRPAPAEPTGLGAVVKHAGDEYISTNRTPGTPRWAFVNDSSTRTEVGAYCWCDFDPDSIEVLSEGIEVES